MTKRLYWQNPNHTSFVGHVTKAETNGRELRLVLDQTLFHPEGGGQPSDHGVLAFPGRSKPVVCQVSQVYDAGDHVVHIIEDPGREYGQTNSALPLPEPGQTVQGTIDRERRFDFMQQHTGQHILSRAFENALQANTVGFHLGGDYVSVDLDIADITVSDVRNVESIANQTVFQDLPVISREYADDVPDHVRSRIPPQGGLIRVVYIGDYDACACSGTHVTSSGQVGLIKINGIDRAHGGVRVIFRCGWRALKDYELKESLLDAAARAFSQSIESVPESVEDLLKKCKDLDKEKDALRKELLLVEIGRILESEKKADAFSTETCVPPIIRCLDGKRSDELKLAARQVSEGTGRLAAFYSREPRFQLVLSLPAGPTGVSGAQAGLNARVLADRIGVALGGKGGGSQGFAQIGAKDPLKDSEENVTRRILDIISRPGLV